MSRWGIPIASNSQLGSRVEAIDAEFRLQCPSCSAPIVHRSPVQHEMRGSLWLAPLQCDECGWVAALAMRIVGLIPEG